MNPDQQQQMQQLLQQVKLQQLLQLQQQQQHPSLVPNGSAPAATAAHQQTATVGGDPQQLFLQGLYPNPIGGGGGSAISTTNASIPAAFLAAAGLATAAPAPQYHQHQHQQPAHNNAPSLPAAASLFSGTTSGAPHPAAPSIDPNNLFGFAPQQQQHQHQAANVPNNNAGFPLQMAAFHPSQFLTALGGGNNGNGNGLDHSQQRQDSAAATNPVLFGLSGPEGLKQQQFAPAPAQTAAVAGAPAGLPADFFLSQSHPLLQQLLLQQQQQVQQQQQIQQQQQQRGGVVASGAEFKRGKKRRKGQALSGGPANGGAPPAAVVAAAAAAAKRNQMRNAKAPWRTHRTKDGKNNGKWTNEERDAFHCAYLKYGKDFETFTKLIPTRTLKQIQSYYSMYKRHHLNPQDGGGVGSVKRSSAAAAAAAAEAAAVGSDGESVVNRKWTDEERQTFDASYKKYGKDFSKIVPLIPTRTLKQIKAYYGMYKRYKLTPPEDNAMSSGYAASYKYYSAIEPGMNTGKWTEQEKRAFHNAYNKYGKLFQKYLKRIPTRNINQIQAYFATYQRYVLTPAEGGGEKKPAFNLGGQPRSSSEEPHTISANSDREGTNSDRDGTNSGSNSDRDANSGRDSQPSD